MPEIKKATVKSYDPATHKAAVRIAGSLAVWLDAVPVATDIPAADVVAGRQCSVLFFDASNPQDAVILDVHGALPSTGVILEGLASADLTLTNTYADITGATVTLPTAGDWLIAATVVFVTDTLDPGQLDARLQVGGVPQPKAVFAGTNTGQTEKLEGSYTAVWKITTATANVIAKLEARKGDAGGVSVARAIATHTRITASGLQRPTGGGGVTDHGALTGLGDDDHTQYQKESEKGAASGYAGLDAGVKVPTAQLGGAGADATKFLRGDQAWAVPGGGGGGFNHAPIGALFPGVLSTGVKPPQVPYRGAAFTATELYCRVSVAPQGAAITVQVRRNGVLMGTVTIAAAAQVGLLAGSVAIASGDYFDINITAVGVAPNEGSDLIWEVVP